ncbi:MAG: hypothetical protein QXF07_00605 [Candidatus Micrarchaeia archaeon]
MENKYNKNMQNNLNKSDPINIDPKYEGLIKENLSGSAHDRVVHSLVEAFNMNPVIRQEAYDRIKSTGRLALPTLYAIMLDDGVCTYVSAKSLGIKRREMETKLKDKEIEDKINIRNTCLRITVPPLISKIVSNLEYEEKNRAVEVFQKVLLREKNQDIIHSVLLSLEKVGDAAIILIHLLNEIAKNPKYSQRNRSQAILLIAKAVEFTKSSGNLLINIISNPNENFDVVNGAISVLTDSAEFLSKEQSNEIVRILTTHPKFIEDTDFRNRSIELFSACGSKVLEQMLLLIEDQNKPLEVREAACFACFGIAKKDYNLEYYILDSFSKLIDKFRPETQITSLVDNNSKIYNLLVDLAKKLSY